MKAFFNIVKICGLIALCLTAIVTLESMQRSEKLRAQNAFVGTFRKCSAVKDTFRVETHGQLLFFIRNGAYYRAEVEQDRLLAYLPRKKEDTVYLEPVAIFNLSTDTLLLSGHGKYYRDIHAER